MTKNIKYFLFCVFPYFAIAQEFNNKIEGFNTSKVPSNPDYSNLSNWASNPRIKDLADEVPKSNKYKLQDGQANAKADVFFVHPTSYTFESDKSSLWNADLNDEKINEKTAEGTIRFQASVFNGSCRVFAPKYRQAHLRVFYTTDKVSAKHALDVAYQDVKSAFEYYLKNENNGRPIIIASHSQGTVHARRLLQEFFDDKPLQKQLVSAYLIGYATQEALFSQLKPSYSANATGGFVSWCTFQENYFPPNYEQHYKGAVVVNPQLWTNSKDWAEKDSNLGLVSAKNVMFENAVSSKAEDGILWIKTPYIMGRSLIHKNNWHVADYNLFWMNIRENVALRIEEFFKKP